MSTLDENSVRSWIVNSTHSCLHFMIVELKPFFLIIKKILSKNDTNKKEYTQIHKLTKIES